jgi:hypothetical protein
MPDKIKWEYTIQTCGTTWHAPQDEELQAVLNSLGEQGWEVFSLENWESSNKVRVAAKRRISTPVRRRSTWPG